MLTYNELNKIVKSGAMHGVRDGAVNAASIDIHFGSRLLVETYPVERIDGRGRVLHLSHRDSTAFVEVDISKAPYILQPGEFALGESAESFDLPLDIACEYKLKSSMARMGLNHMLAGWCDPGWNGSVLTLEIKNELRFHSIAIRAGDPAGQMVFDRGEPVPLSASYAARGRYNGDKSVSGIKK